MQLQLPANIPLMIGGIICRVENEFALQMKVFDSDGKTVTRVFPLRSVDERAQGQLEEFEGETVTLQGRWHPSPYNPTGSGTLQVAAVWKQPCPEQAIDPPRRGNGEANGDK
jgi:hypothetical protein